MTKSEIYLQKLENKIASLVVYFKDRLPKTHEGNKLAIKIAIRHAERAGWLKMVPDLKSQSPNTLDKIVNNYEEDL